MANSRKFPYILNGDAVAAVIDIIMNYTPELTGSLAVDRVSSDMVGYTKGAVWVLVEVEGGSYRFLKTKRTRCDITVYGPDGPHSRQTSYDISAAIQASLFAMQSGYRNITYGIYFQACQIESDIFRGNDKNEDPVRHIQSLRLLLLPAIQ